MYEVEVKVRAAHGPVRERLAALGAEPAGTVHQRDTYYDHPGRDFAETDEALRLRRVRAEDGTESTILTYKGPREGGGTKTREELETGLPDDESIAAILDALGFDPAATIEKERERFSVGSHAVALDRVNGLGEFVEVEAEGEATEVEALRYGAVELCRELGLDPDAAVEASYLELSLQEP